MSGYQNEFVRIKEALRLNPRGMTISEISREINVNRNSVAKYLDVMLISGQVEMRPIGRAKLYYLSQRVPMSAMLNLSSEYIMVFNREYRIMQGNDAFLDFLNIEREAIIGRELKDASLYIFDDPNIQSGIKKGFEGMDSSKELSFQIDDAELYFKIKFIPTTFDDGEQGATIIMENITERKKAERALQESEERFRELADLLPQCIYETDERGNFTFANRRALETFSYSQKDLEKGLNVIQTIIHEDVDRSRKNVQRILSGEELSGIKYTALRKDGSTFPMIIYSSPIIRGNKPTGLRGIAIDITECKRMEEELREMNWSLKERVKELTCLYGIARLVEQSGIDLEGILEGIVSLIPPAWQYPEVTCVRIIVDEHISKTDNFKDTEWRQTAEIKVSGETRGTVEVYYLEEKPESYEGPFLKEERDLIDAIAERTGRIIERKWMEEALRKSEAK